MVARRQFVTNLLIFDDGGDDGEKNAIYTTLFRIAMDAERLISALRRENKSPFTCLQEAAVALRATLNVLSTRRKREQMSATKVGDRGQKISTVIISGSWWIGEFRCLKPEAVKS
jgi:hypothetical protein